MCSTDVPTRIQIPHIPSFYDNIHMKVFKFITMNLQPDILFDIIGVICIFSYKRMSVHIYLQVGTQCTLYKYRFKQLCPYYIHLCAICMGVPTTMLMYINHRPKKSDCSFWKEKLSVVRRSRVACRAPPIAVRRLRPCACGKNETCLGLVT